MLALAPDPASAKAGQGLATPRKWVTLGADEQAAWGECQGSGAKPYQVQVELAGPTFKCSCPSRKFPCKHGLGLMLLVAGGSAAKKPQPAWVAEWLAGRAQRADKKAAKADAPPKPVDEAAQAKRREKRRERAGEGLAALRLWIEDLVRGGLATAPTRGYAFFDDQAKRMVDAQAPGVANRLQGLSALASAGSGWQRPFAEALASLYLLASSYERLDGLPPDSRDDVFEALGFPRPQDQILTRPPVRDRWQVVAQETTQEDRLRVQRTWLYAAAARRPALVLAFAPAGMALETPLPVGFSLDAELCFYPGNGVRAAVKSRQDPKPIVALDGLDTFDALCDWASGLRARQPWVGEVVAPVRAVTPVRLSGTADRAAGWALVDGVGQTLPARVGDAAGWRLLAAAGGRPVDLVLAYDFAAVRPLAVAHDGTYATLTAGEAEDEVAA